MEHHSFPYTSSHNLQLIDDPEAAWLQYLRTFSEEEDFSHPSAFFESHHTLQDCPSSQVFPACPSSQLMRTTTQPTSQGDLALDQISREFIIPPANLPSVSPQHLRRTKPTYLVAYRTEALYNSFDDQSLPRICTISQDPLLPPNLKVQLETPLRFHERAVVDGVNTNSKSKATIEDPCEPTKHLQYSNGAISEIDRRETELRQKQEPTARSSEKKTSGKLPRIQKPKKVRGPKLFLRTRSDVDIIDDGYKWRKYGQKTVKDSLFPRGYYKCTDKYCHVKKHIERDTDAPSFVVTTYEGIHNHTSCPVPIQVHQPIVASSQAFRFSRLDEGLEDVDHRELDVSYLRHQDIELSEQMYVK